MNSKKTNYINGILNILLLFALMIIQLFFDSTIISYTSFFNNKIIDFILDNYNNILMIIFSSMFVWNLISTIQNKNDKKMLFWKIALCVSLVMTMIQVYLDENIKFELEKNLTKIFFGSIPTILAMVNLILIKKNKPKPLKVISYIVVIIFSISIFFNAFEFEKFTYIGMIWCVISSIMQLRYTHVQDVYENKSRKIVNIIIYYIIQTVFTCGIMILVIYSISVCKINESKLKSEVKDVANRIYENSDSNNEYLIRVERDSKFGYINEKGEEIIPVEYDLISKLQIRIKHKECICYIAKKDNDYYIILDNKNVIDLKDYKSNFFDNKLRNGRNSSPNNSRLYLTAGEYLNLLSGVFTQMFSPKSIEMTPYNVEIDENDNQVYTYRLQDNVEMTAVKIKNDEYKNMREYECNVITKSYHEVIRNDKNVFIPIDNYGTIRLYSNHSIPFCNLEKNIQGWYDSTTGEVKVLHGNYQILDITDDDKLIIKDYNTNEKYERLIDRKTGNVVMVGNHIEFISTENNKLFICYDDNLGCRLMDSNGNVLTKQKYTKIEDESGKFITDVEIGKMSEKPFDNLYENYYKTNETINN